MTWQVYYTETGKSLRQMITLVAASMYDAMKQAEQQLYGREIVFLAAVQTPLKLQHGEC